MGKREFDGRVLPRDAAALQGLKSARRQDQEAAAGRGALPRGLELSDAPPHPKRRVVSGERKYFGSKVSDR